MLATRSLRALWMIFVVLLSSQGCDCSSTDDGDDDTTEDADVDAAEPDGGWPDPPDTDAAMRRGRFPGLNREPSFLTQPPLGAREGEGYRYAPQVDDLDGDLIVWVLDEAPTGMRVSESTGTIFWLPDQQAAGSYDVTLRAHDENGAMAEQRWTIAVEADFSAPKIRSWPTTVGYVGTEWTYELDIEDLDGDELAITTTEDPGSLIVEGRTLRFTPPSGGAFPVTVRVEDPAGLTDVQSFQIAVAEAGDTTGPVVVLDTPVRDATLEAPVDALGTVTDPALADWVLEACRGTFCREMHRSSLPVDDDVLGRVDPALLDPGDWQLRLRARDAAGNQSFVTRDVHVESVAQVGAIRIGFIDFVLPVGGIEIEVRREYNGSDLSTGEYGAGWKLTTNFVTPDMVTPALELPPTPIGGGWTAGYDPLGGAYVEGDPRFVKFTLPDGREYPLFFYPEAEGGITGGALVHQVFDGPPGITVQTLDASGDPYGDLIIRFGNDQIERFDGVEVLGPYEPTQFNLTTEFGEVYRYDDEGHLLSFRDDEGVEHEWMGGSDGIGDLLEVTRNAAGNITRLRDDETGDVADYEYDDAGDLVDVTYTGGDMDGDHQTFAYASGHRMTGYDAPGARIEQVEYDDQGRVSRVIDGNGGVTEWFYEENRRIRVSPTGARTVFELGEDGLVTGIRQPNGALTQYQYDDAGREVAVTDPMGARRRTEYDSDGRVTAIIDAEGRRRTLSYDGDGKLTGFSDGMTSYRVEMNGNEVSFLGPDGTVLDTMGYDDEGNLLSHDENGSDPESFEYDDNGQLVSATTAEGDHVEMTYERRGLVQHVHNMDTGETTDITYTVSGNVRELSTQGTTFRYRYDVNGVPRRVEHDGVVTELRQDGVGNVVSVVDDGSMVAQRRLDGDGHSVALATQSGLVRRTDVDVMGNALAVHGSEGVEMRTYDETQRITSVVLADGSMTEYAYDRAGLMTEIRTEGGMTALRYDEGGRPSVMTDQSGRVTRFAYDAYGRPSGVAQPGQGMQTYEYETTNMPFEQSRAPRITALTSPTGERWEYGYEGTARDVTEVTDPMGRVTHYEYDRSGAPTRIELPGDLTYTLVRENGDIVALQRPSGRTTSWTYLPDGSSEETRPDGSKIVTAFDETGGTVSTATSDGLSLRTQGGEFGLEVSSGPGGSVVYEHDDQGRLTRVLSDDGAEARYVYDGADQVVETWMRAPSGEAFRTTYEYDAGQMVAMTAPDGRWTFEYDASHRLTNIVRPNGVETIYTYDERPRPKTLRHVDAAGGVLASYEFTYDLGGRLTRQVGPDGTHDYTYDAMGNLASDDHDGSGVTRWAYDAIGNITSRTTNAGTEGFEYSRDGELTAIGAGDYASDGRGNLVGGGGRRFTYDSMDRLTSVVVDGRELELGYEGTTRPLSRRVDGEVQRCLYAPGPDGLDYCVMQYGSHGANAFLFGPAGVAARVGADGARYPLAGNLRTVETVTDASGAVTGRVRYDVWGKKTASEGESFEYGYTGEYQDPATGLVYLRSRWYDPTSARFLTEDRAAGTQDPRSHNRYGYLSDATPTNAIDPLGAFSAVEINVSMSIGDTMRALKNAAVQCARQAVKDAITQAIVAWTVQLLVQFVIGPMIAPLLDRLGAAIAGAANRGGAWSEQIRRLFCGSSALAVLPVFPAEMRFEVPITRCGAMRFRGRPGNRRPDNHGSFDCTGPLDRDNLGGVIDAVGGTFLDILLMNVFPIEVKAGKLYDQDQLAKYCRFSARAGSHMTFVALGGWPPVRKGLARGRPWRPALTQDMVMCGFCWKLPRDGSQADARHCSGGPGFSLGQDEDASPGSSRGTVAIFFGREGSHLRMFIPDPKSIKKICSAP